MGDPVSVICIGGAAIDRKYRVAQTLTPATSNPVSGITSFGGVARNVSENLANLEVPTLLVSAVGNDHDGHALRRHLRSAGVDCDRVVTGPGATASYIAALNPDGSLAVALADMAIFDTLSVDRLAEIDIPVARADWLFADCNLPQSTLRYIIELAASAPCKLAIDAVSIAKSSRLSDDLTGIDLLFVNQDEALALSGVVGPPESAGRALQMRGAETVIVTLGPNGCMACGPSGAEHVPAIGVRMEDATGAGDALIAGTLAGLIGGKTLNDALVAGAALAARALVSTGSVSAD